MPFRNRNRMHPINTLKHVIDNQGATVGGGTTDITLVSAVENAVSTTPDANDVGSHVRSIFLNVQVVNTVDATGLVNNIYFYLFGNPGNNIPGATLPNANAVGSSDSRKQIFHQEMAMLSDANDSIPITMFKGVIRIPKKFQRLGVNDEIGIRITSPTGGPEATFCVQCIYKEIR